LYGTVKAICTLIFGFFIVDRIGRRRPLMYVTKKYAGEVRGLQALTRYPAGM
jgi:hypothetical protein